MSQLDQRNTFKCVDSLTNISVIVTFKIIITRKTQLNKMKMIECELCVNPAVKTSLYFSIRYSPPPNVHLQLVTKAFCLVVEVLVLTKGFSVLAVNFTV